MASVPITVIRENYILKSTFFYNRLKTGGYFDLFFAVQEMSKVEGKNLNWDNYLEWNITDSAFKTLRKSQLDPMLVFVHPKILQLHPTFLKYYRSVAMISQKGLKALTGISNIDKIEAGRVAPSKLKHETVNNILKIINEILSLIISLSSGLDSNEIQGMMYATVGTNIDGSWRNSIGVEGERVIRSIILKSVIEHNEVSSIINKQDKTQTISELKTETLLDNIDNYKIINLTNGYSIMFSSEPDISMYNDEGSIIGIVEIKAGLDPAGALERLGAMLKSFENTLAEYPEAVTVLVASCITKEVESRLGSSMAVKQKYVTSEITFNESSQRKFANNMRRILKLIK